MARRSITPNSSPLRNLWAIALIVSAVLALVGVGGVVMQRTGSAGAEPGRLVALQPTVDLGRVPFDREVEARYVLENTGDRLVRIVAAPVVKTLEGC